MQWTPIEIKFMEMYPQLIEGFPQDIRELFAQMNRIFGGGSINYDRMMTGLIYVKYGASAFILNDEGEISHQRYVSVCYEVGGIVRGQLVNSFPLPTLTIGEEVPEDMVRNKVIQVLMAELNISNNMASKIAYGLRIKSDLYSMGWIADEGGQDELSL